MKGRPKIRHPVHLHRRKQKHRHRRRQKHLKRGEQKNLEQRGERWLGGDTYYLWGSWKCDESTWTVVTHFLMEGNRLEPCLQPGTSLFFTILFFLTHSRDKFPLHSMPTSANMLSKDKPTSSSEAKVRYCNGCRIYKSKLVMLESNVEWISNVEWMLDDVKNFHPSILYKWKATKIDKSESKVLSRVYRGVHDKQARFVGTILEYFNHSKTSKIWPHGSL